MSASHCPAPCETTRRKASAKLTIFYGFSAMGTVKSSLRVLIRSKFHLLSSLGYLKTHNE